MSGYSLGELYEQAQQKIRALETELAETRRDRDTYVDLWKLSADTVLALQAELTDARQERDDAGLRWGEHYNAETGRLTDTITAARDLAVHNRDRAEQAAEQVRRIHAQPVADAFAELAELLGDEA